MTDIKKITPSKLLWLDMEMTGLDPAHDRILEVAAIITDWDFSELAAFEAVVHQSPQVLERMNDWARAQHHASGLTQRVAEGMPEAQAEDSLCQLVKTHFGDEPALLAGNSIHQDRQFIRHWWPNLEKQLHYRMLDVSAWKVVMIGKYGTEFPKKETHRALDDIRESIAELQSYLAKAKL
jgi:oligoribonuclease